MMTPEERIALATVLLVLERSGPKQAPIRSGGVVHMVELSPLVRILQRVLDRAAREARA